MRGGKLTDDGERLGIHRAVDDPWFLFATHYLEIVYCGGNAKGPLGAGALTFEMASIQGLISTSKLTEPCAPGRKAPVQSHLKFPVYPALLVTGKANEHVIPPPTETDHKS